MDDMVYIHCGSYVCHPCILKEAKKIKRKNKKEKKPKGKGKCYEGQEIKDPNVSSGIHYIVSHIPTDSRIATCYLQHSGLYPGQVYREQLAGL